LHGWTTPGALDGVLVADFSRAIAGPLAAMTLADLGADVVKVERPGTGDETRSWGPPWWDEQTSTYYLAFNRGKRSLRLDLADPADLAIARELVLRADVVVENFRPGTMDRLGLGWTDLSRERPDLVYCSISGFGSGPGADLGGYDFLAQALTGLMELTGVPDGPAVKAGIPVADVLTGLHATIGILAALAVAREGRTGQRVEVSLLDAALASLGNHATAHLNAGARPTRVGNRHPSIAPYEVVAAADGPLVVAAATDAQFRKLCAVVGLDHLAADPRFLTNSGRVANRTHLTSALERALAMAGAAVWAARLQAAGVPAAPVQGVAEGFALAEELELQPVDEVHDSTGRVVRTARNPVRLDATPLRTKLPPPALGEHDETLRAWLSRPRGTVLD
jgi:formyl-CoA transferase